MPGAIGAAALSLIGITAAATSTAALVVGNLIVAGVAIGAQMLIGRMTQPATPKPSDVQQELRQPMPPRRKSYGRVRVSGAVWWLATDAANPRNLYMGIALNHGRIHQIVSYHIDENEVTIDGTGQVTTAPYSAITPTRLLTRLGLPTETAYSDISSVFGVANVRGDGVATLLGVFRNKNDATEQMEIYPSGLPSLRVTMDASVCFDPRQAGQSVTNQATWTFSENPIVVLLNYLIDPDGYGMPWARIEPNLAEWKAAMDVCDEQVTTITGEAIARYRLAGSFEFTARPRDVVQQILATCDGRVWQRRDGSLGVIAGRYYTPTVTIESRDILSYSIERGQDRLTAVAGLRAQYMSPSHDYREHEPEPWPDGATVLGLDEERVEALDLTWVPHRNQARRLMKREFLRQTAEWRGTVATNLAGIRAMDERFVTLRIEDNAFSIDQSFEIDRFTFDPSTMRCQIEVKSVGAEIDDFSPSEEGPASLGFAYASRFKKNGTTLDLLAETGAQIGQTAIVIMVASDDSPWPSVPAGWGLIMHTGAGSTGVLVAIRACFRVINGTEGNETLLPESGPIMVVLFNGCRVPIRSDLSGSASSSVISAITLEAISSPCAAIFVSAHNEGNTNNSTSPPTGLETTWFSESQVGNDEAARLIVHVWDAERPSQGVTLTGNGQGSYRANLGFIIQPAA
jgi:hypothetical protein